MSKPIRFTESRLHDTRLTAGQVPVVTTGTLLVDVTNVFLEHECHHLLVQDNDGTLIGIVSVDDLNQAMRGAEDDAAAHWHHRTVESLLSVTLEAEAAESDSPFRTANQPVEESLTQCVSVREGGDLLALMTSQDVLLSWTRLEPALARAATDALTRLPNRAHFERRFKEEWERATRLNLTLGLLIIDVDNFKEINDRFGHLRGDLVLASVSQCCQRCLRSYDLVARFAGDEFVAVTCGCSPTDLDLPIRRLQTAIRTLELSFNDERVPTSLSVGAAVVRSGLDGLQPNDLLEAADACVYEAKHRGRDRAYRVELFGNGTTSPAVRVDAEPATIA
jgi:diguanylate cyclase (GGDEF)-like protein